MSKFWEDEQQRALAYIMPLLQEFAEQGTMAGQLTLQQLGLAVDSTLAQTAAADWARQFTDDLLISFGTTNQKIVGSILGSWIETPGATLGDLSTQLARRLGNLDQDAPIPPSALSRARMIAVTEVTRAMAKGEEAVYAEAGLPKVVFGAPAHVRCRCWSVVRRLSNGEFVIVWQTNRDEIVCQTPITVPWSSKKVPGCRYLHDRVISEGPYLGQLYTDVVKNLQKR